MAALEIGKVLEERVANILELAVRHGAAMNEDNQGNIYIRPLGDQESDVSIFAPEERLRLFNLANGAIFQASQLDSSLSEGQSGQ